MSCTNFCTKERIGLTAIGLALVAEAHLGTTPLSNLADIKKVLEVLNIPEQGVSRDILRNAKNLKNEDGLTSFNGV